MSVIVATMAYKLRFKRYTAEEIDYLKKNFKNSKYKEIAEYLGKTELSVRRKVTKLHLRKRDTRNYKQKTLKCVDCGQLFTTFEYLTRRRSAPKLRCDECSKVHRKELVDIWFQENREWMNNIQREYYKTFGKEKEAKRREWNKERAKIYRLRNKEKRQKYDDEYINRLGVRERKNARRRWLYWNVPGYREKRLTMRRKWGRNNKWKVTKFNQKQWKKLKNNPVKYEKYKKKRKNNIKNELKAMNDRSVRSAKSADFAGLTDRIS